MGVGSHVTVAKERLTFTGLMMVDEPKLGERGVYFLRYGATSNLDVGVGYWATPGRPRPAVNWQAVRQGERRPAVLVGYGSEPLGQWKDDGVYVSLVKGFGPPRRRTHAFAALYHEISGDTNHLIGGVNQPVGDRWALFVGRYPFNSWDASISCQLSPQIQLGLWACDFGRSTQLGLSIGTGWSMTTKKVRKGH